jgi:TPP-dependent 2-oxoacid decarboxylase
MSINSCLMIIYLLPILLKKLNIKQDILGGDTAVISETGDSWFNCQKLRLPENCG